ncbi:methylenetetrahydrofolate reductase [Sesbania bispinosa]|nr:methylenetetrahydrofolate reductase [Sesbania bispinosa]
MPPFSFVDPVPPFTNGHRALDNPCCPFSFFDPSTVVHQKPLCASLWQSILPLSRSILERSRVSSSKQNWAPPPAVQLHL